ncbi:protease pro-enzyme activation domain-containing protein [Dyella flava]|uniref:S8/S53 family peptidase n=1 Tax=Dyella flava TaxID=1920170 RepID=A0ABS2K1G6_9GAMM|nr:S53 family peptidase [Dyella flava]MBM7125092.1 S8/S53 family peptidase [Dyella flava]GLQ51965.1 pseudomonapepsin [Dyella flava]
MHVSSSVTKLSSVSKLSRFKRTLPALLIAGALAVGAPASYASAGTGAFSLQMQDHVPVAVRTGQAISAQALDANKQLKLGLVLPLRNESELDSLIAQLYDPGSPFYHHYLNSKEFTARFEPSQADYDKVVAWAKANNLSITATTANRHIVDVQGKVSDINRALHVTMRQYQHPTENRLFFAPDREPTVDLGVQLLHINGLDNYVRPFTHMRHRPASEQAQVAHASTGSGPGGNYLPSDIRAAYYGSGSLTGSGQTAAIFSYDGYQASDLSGYYSATGATDPGVAVNNVLVNGFSGACTNPSTGSSSCSDGEQILDIANLAGMAPGLTQILFYEGSSAGDILNQMASDDTASVISSSWGGGDFGSSDDSIYKEFQAQGQTFVNASGDAGSYTTSNWAPPSLDPYITDVGATDLTTSGPGGSWESETAWSDSSGGYLSSAGYSIPSYQQLAGVINSSNKGSTQYRNDPDIALEGNFDNPTYSNGQLETDVGGTSYAAPRLAGVIALANQQAAADGVGNIGFLNTALYNFGVGSNYHSYFHDITSGSNGGFKAVAGYDLVTGWGSPVGPAFISALVGTK